MIEIEHHGKPDSERERELQDCWRKVLAREDVGFPKIAERDADWEALDRRLDDCRDTRRVLVAGIGGSSLGTQVIHECFRNSSAVEVQFLESPSPHVWTSLRNLAPDWLDNHLVIVSKSGNTLETLTWVERLAAGSPSWFQPEHCTVVASPGEGALQKWAKKNNINCLWIPGDVGGRFSVLTAAGMFPAGLMGLSLHEFRAGAEWALDHSEMAVSLAREILRSWERGEWVTQMWTYSEGLRVFGEWWQQLWSESLGKKIDRQGRPAPRVSTPMSCRGPRDQHSLAQQLIEGTKDKSVFVTRVRSVEESDGLFQAKLFPEMPFHEREISLGKIVGVEAEAFERSLEDAQVSHTSVVLESINERTMGGIFMLWQMTIALLGEFLSINAFDQPGVELGKRHAAQILQH
jgi:glucose-6-phosphate isomerase